MIKINLICIGDIKEKYLTDAINEYSKRISPFANLKIIELKEKIWLLKIYMESMPSETYNLG